MTAAIRVLYVDDDPQLLEIGKQFLEKNRGFSVECACSGNEALRLIAAGQYDAVVSGYQMPGMNGITLLKEVRATDKVIPFILFTGKGRDEVVIEALNNGADFYLQRGGEPQSQFAELSHKIRHAVRQRRAEEAWVTSAVDLREATSRYEALIAASNTGAWEYQTDSGFLWCSPEYFSMIGRNIRDFDLSGARNIEQTWIDLLHPEDRERASQHFNTYLSNPVGMYEQQFRMLHKDGHWVWILSRGKTLRDKKGLPTSMTVGTHIEITERKHAEEELLNKNKELIASHEQIAAAEEELRASLDELTGQEQALRESEARFRTIIHSMQFGIVIIDVKTHTILEANKKALDMIGGDNNTVVGSVCHRFICPAECGRCPVTDLGQTVDSSERVLLTRRGEKIPILKSVIQTTLSGNEVLIESFIDIIERKRAEDSLQRVNQKLNVLSQLTRQDLTNQTFVLNGYLQLAKKQAAGQDRLIGTVQKGVSAVQSIHETIEYSKDYQDMGAKPPKWQNVKMTSLLGLSHMPLGNIQHSIEPENLEIYADPLLEKVCQRLFENSVKHGDHVTRIRVWHTVTPDGVIIVYEDNGIGIPQEKKEQIFLRSEGTGPSMRSLIFVREILDITGITIRETGEPGTGARFEMTVPKGAWRIAGKAD